jgi:hypothetical protein
MARPNILTFKSDDNIIQMVSNTEFNIIADVVLEKFALSDGPGSLVFNTAGANANFTLIGTFSDTYTANDVGGSDITVLTVDYDIYQDRTINYGTPSDRPLTWDYSTNSIRKLTDSEFSDFADDIVEYMVTQEGPGCYRLSNTAPTGYGGTWTQEATLTNFLDASTSNSPTGLWQKVDNGTTLTHRPLKAAADIALQLMTDGQVDSLAEKVRQRITATSIGYYALQGSAPGTGTWANVGTHVDSRRDTTPGVTYTGTLTYSGDYTGNYTGLVEQNFYGPIRYVPGSPVTYLGPGPAGYTQQYFFNYSTGTYVGTSPDSAPFTAPGSPSAFQGVYTGGSPTDYAGEYVGEYSTDASYTLAPTSQISEVTLWRRIG